MFRWSLMLRKLFTSSSSVRKTSDSSVFRFSGALPKRRRPRPSVKLSLEGMEERTMPSATGVNPLATVVLASPPPAPSFAAVASFVSSTMDRVDHILALVDQVVRTAEQMLGGKIAQAEATVNQQLDHLLGIPNGNGSGSGSTTASNAPNQQLHTGTQKVGYPFTRRGWQVPA